MRCNINDLIIMIMQPHYIYFFSTDYDNYGIFTSNGHVDGNNVSKSDDSYDYHTCTNDDDDDDEILTVENSRGQMVK